MAEAQYRVGPVYPENPQGSPPASYNPFQLNWTSGRFDYVPVPYDLEDSSDPYRFNAFSGRWDYVPSLGPAIAPSEAPPQPVQGTVSLSPILPTALTRTSEPAPPVMLAPIIAPQIENFYYRRPSPTTAPTTAPTMTARPSLAPTTRPAAAASVSLQD